MNPRMLGAVAALALLAAGCAKKDSATDAAATGAGGASGIGSGSSVTPGTQEDLVANIGDRVLFDTDSSTVGSDQRPILERQAGWMQQYASVRVQVEGHADERGT